jgi:hypothetical protein
MMSPLGYAMMYADQWGWYLFPIRAPFKDRPLVKWKTESSNDPKQICEWWGKWPTANIGVDCGRTGIFVLDVDQHSTAADGTKSLDLLELGVLPETLRQITPSGGLHYIFRGNFRSSIGELGPGLDTRGPGGMILASDVGQQSDAQSDRPAGAAWAADGRRRLFFLVFHRALPDLQRMKLCHSVAASSASRATPIPHARQHCRIALAA